MTTQFESDPLAGVLSGTMTAATFETPKIGTDVPTRLIRTTQDWGVKVDWSVTGPLLPLMNEEFEVRVYIEDLGPAENESTQGPYTVQTSAGVDDPVNPGTKLYTHNVNIPAGTLPAGVYQVTALVQLHNIAPAHPWPVAAFESLPIINIYEPV